MINYVGNIFKESKSISIDIELRTAKTKSVRGSTTNLTCL